MNSPRSEFHVEVKAHGDTAVDPRRDCGESIARHVRSWIAPLPLARSTPTMGIRRTAGSRAASRPRRQRSMDFGHELGLGGVVSSGLVSLSEILLTADSVQKFQECSVKLLRAIQVARVPGVA